MSDPNEEKPDVDLEELSSENLAAGVVDDRPPLIEPADDDGTAEEDDDE